MEIGIDSFAARFSRKSAAALSDIDAMEQLLERMVHADRVGLDVFGIGEHHRKGFLDSAPAELRRSCFATLLLVRSLRFARESWRLRRLVRSVSG